jgi:hypothetical protein
MELPFLIVDYSIQMSKIGELTLNQGEMNNSRRVPSFSLIVMCCLNTCCRAFMSQVVLFKILYLFCQALIFTQEFPYFNFIMWCNMEIQDKIELGINWWVKQT